MRTVVRIAGLALALVIFATGCVSKGWVRELLGKKEAEIDERFLKRDADFNQRLAEVGGRVEDTRVQVQSLGTSVDRVREAVSEAQRRADAAVSRADAAFARTDEVDSRVTRLWRNRHARELVETAHVQFGFDRWNLNDAAQKRLLSLVRELRGNPGLLVELEGYTDSVGTHEYNLRLSWRRVEAVRRFLIENGIELPRVHAIGLGPLPDNGTREERAKNRRVTVKLMRLKD